MLVFNLKFTLQKQGHCGYFPWEQILIAYHQMHTHTQSSCMKKNKIADSYAWHLGWLARLTVPNENLFSLSRSLAAKRRLVRPIECVQWHLTDRPSSHFKELFVFCFFFWAENKNKIKKNVSNERLKCHFLFILFINFSLGNGFGISTASRINALDAVCFEQFTQFGFNFRNNGWPMKNERCIYL